MSNPLKVNILRPGRARTRLEAQTLAEIRPCPNCGKTVKLSARGPVSPEGGGIWEVTADCYSCGSILRYVFDPAASWDPASDTDPDPFAPRLGPKGTVTEILTASDLRSLIEATRPQLARFESRLGDDPPDRLILQTAQLGLVSLRALRELEALGIALTDQETALKARLEGHEARARGLKG